MLKSLLLRQYKRVFRISRWMRMHFTVMGHLCLLVWVMAGVLGVDTQSTTTYQLFVLMSVLLFFALLGSLVNRFRASIHRHLPRYATVGEPLVYQVSIRNQTHKNYHDLAYVEQLILDYPSYAELMHYYQREQQPWYRCGISFRLWRRYLYYQQGAYIDEQPLEYIGYQQPESLTLSLTPLRRGKLNFIGAYIAKPDLLGLFKRFYFAEKRQSCWVLPKRYPVNALALQGRRQYQSGGVSLANSVGDSPEFMSLREYQQGDALNQIHWKSFARHGKLIVKQYQDEYFVRRALLLDTYLGEQDNELFEAAVSVTASIAISERQTDALLDFMFVGQDCHRFTTGRGVDHMPHLQEVLATVQRSDAQSFAKLVAAVLGYQQQCSSMVCVLLHWDQERQDFIHSLQQASIPIAVFLLHDGSLTLAKVVNKPEHFYLIDRQQLARDLAAI